MSLEFTSEIKEKSSVLVINLEGSILGKTETLELTEYIDSNIESGNNYVILNLEKLDFMNSTGINVLISYLTKLRNSGGELIIAHLSKKVEQLLVITKLHSVFTIVDSVEAGLAKLLEIHE